MMLGSLWQSHIWKWELIIGNSRKGSLCYNMAIKTNKIATSTEMCSSILWKIKFVSSGIEYHLRRLVSKVLKEQIGPWWLLTVKCGKREIRKVKHEEIRIWGQKFFSLSLIQKNEKACSEGDPGNVADKNYEYDSWTY